MTAFVRDLAVAALVRTVRYAARHEANYEAILGLLYSPEIAFVWGRHQVDLTLGQIEADVLGGGGA